MSTDHHYYTQTLTLFNFSLSSITVRLASNKRVFAQIFFIWSSIGLKCIFNKVKHIVAVLMYYNGRGLTVKVNGLTHIYNMIYPHWYII